MSETTEKHHEKDPRLVEARDHMKAARQAMHRSVESLLPEGFMESRRTARKEFLLGLRSLVDAAIAHLEKKPEE